MISWFSFTITILTPTPLKKKQKKKTKQSHYNLNSYIFLIAGEFTFLSKKLVNKNSFYNNLLTEIKDEDFMRMQIYQLDFLGISHKQFPV